MYDLLLPSDIKGLKLLSIMPSGKKRCHINLQPKAAGLFKQYMWSFVTGRD